MTDEGIECGVEVPGQNPSSFATLPTTNPTGHAVLHILWTKCHCYTCYGQSVTVTHVMDKVSLLHMLWTKCHCYNPFSLYFSFAPSVSFQQCFTPVFHSFTTSEVIPARVLWHPMVPRNLYTGSTSLVSFIRSSYLKAHIVVVAAA